MFADRPFVDRPPADLAAAGEFASAVAAQLDLPTPVLTNLGMNAIYTCGDVVLRVSHVNGPATSAYELADALAAAGVRVPRPAPGRHVVTDAEVARDGTGLALVATVWAIVPAVGEPADWFEIGTMVMRVSELAPSRVPAAYPLPLCTVYPWWQFDELLAAVAGEIDEPARRGMVAAVEQHRGWVETSGGSNDWVLCHGDVHPHNVIAGPDGPVIIDWDLLCVGPPGWDHAPLRSMVQRWGARREWYDDFARGYGADLSGDAVTNALTTLRLVAATLMRVQAGRTDRTARDEAERRLRYWRGDPAAPTWLMS